MTFEIIFDDQEFTVWQIGNWQLTHTKDGEIFWVWVGDQDEQKAIAKTLRTTGASRPTGRGDAGAECVSETSGRHLVRRDLRCVPRGI